VILITDIDHTLADAAWRDHLIGGEGGWDGYHEQACKDKPIRTLVALINAMHLAHWNVVAVTTRPEKWRAMTMRWLIDVGVRIDTLLMRPANDYRPSPELKVAQVLEYFPKLRDNLVIVLDDREDVIAAFVAIGITALQVRAQCPPS
jgi:hypothetical protein